MKSLKKLLYFLDFPFNVGGSNKILLTQAYLMKQKGVSVNIVIPDDENEQHAKEYEEICKNYGLQTRSVKFCISTCIEEIDIVRAMRDYENIVSIIASVKPDLIHSAQMNVTVELAARKFKIPHLMNIYQVDQTAFHVKWLHIYPQYHSADSVLFSERWKRGLDISSKCIRTACDMTGNEENRCRKNKTAVVNIVVIGVLCERKNQLEVIKFILKCKKRGYDVKLLILGNNQNDYGDLCKNYVIENRLQEEVVFQGFVSNVEDYLKWADLCVLASIVESYPVAIVESMANKVPIISTPVAGIPELLKDEVNAFLTEGEQAEDIYKAFCRFLKYRNSNQISKITENAYATYLKYHTYEAVGRELEDYYNWILEDYRSKKDTVLLIDEIKKEFEKFICNRKINKDNPEVMLKLWLFYHIFFNMQDKKNKKVIIWGAGFWGAVALEGLVLYNEQIEFMGFIDTKKQGEYLGHAIIQKEDVTIAECGTILVALADKEDRLEIANYLEKHGKVRNKDYFLVCNFTEPVKL